MNKKTSTSSLVIAAACASVLSASPAVATPLCDANQSLGVLGGPVAQVPVDDPTIRRAIEMLRGKFVREEIIQKKKLDSPIGKRDLNRKLILGGPEIVPM